MKKLLPKIIEKVHSPKNGEISVIEQFGKRKIVVSKLTQSGPVMEEIWQEAMKMIQRFVQNDNHRLEILVLGLGGGSIVKVLNKHFSNLKITAIDYDSIMIELGKKYLGLKESENLKIILEDANLFLQKNRKLFDLIFVDLFSGETIPKKSQTKFFLQKIQKKLAKNGLIVFNRPYYQNHIFEAKVFLDKLKKIFDDVKGKKILTNLLVFCRN